MQVSFVTLFYSKNKLTQFIIKKKREKGGERDTHTHTKTPMTTPIEKDIEETNPMTLRNVKNYDHSGVTRVVQICQGLFAFG